MSELGKLQYCLNLRWTNSKEATKFIKASPATNRASGTEVHEAQMDPLRTVRELSKIGEHAAFYSQLNTVLWDILAIKLNLPLTELNKNNVAGQLKLKGWNNEMVDNLQEILIKCERNIYISGYSHDTDFAAQLHMADKIMDDLANI